MFKTKKVIGVIAIAVVVSVVAYAAPIHSAAYQDFKTLLKSQDEQHIQSGTMQGAFKLTDNEHLVLDVKIDAVKNASDEMSAEVALKADTLEKLFKIYSTRETAYLYDKANNDIYVKSQIGDTDEAYSDDDVLDAQSEIIFDFFMRDFANKFEYKKDDDGSKDIMFNVTSDDMPKIVNAIVTKMAQEKEYEHGETLTAQEKAELQKMMDEYPLFKELNTIIQQQDELVREIVIDNISVLLDRDLDDEFVGVTLDVTFSGQDKEGKAHRVNAVMSLATSEDENVEVSALNLDGKNVYFLPEHATIFSR